MYVLQYAFISIMFILVHVRCFIYVYGQDVCSTGQTKIEICKAESTMNSKSPPRAGERRWWAETIKLQDCKPQEVYFIGIVLWD